MVERKVSFNRYLGILIVTIVVFVIGLLLGITVVKTRVSYLEDVAYKQKIDYESLQLQSMYIDIIKTNQSCPVFNKILEASLDDVANAQMKIDSYMKESSSNSYVEIKRDYVLAQIRYWLLNNKIIESCGSDSVAILYFYSNEDCFECSTQGTILSYLKEKLGKRLLVFSLDSDFEAEPMVSVVKGVYNITTVPSLILKNEKMDGFIDLKNLTTNICFMYKSKPEFCMDEASVSLT